MVPRGKSLKSFFIVFILITVIFVLGSIFWKSHREKNLPVVQDQKVEYLSFPKIGNVPPRSVSVNSEFTFLPKLVPNDQDAKILLNESPDWLNLHEGVVSGVPDELGSYNFVLRVEKDDRYEDEIFYLVVIDVEDE